MPPEEPFLCNVLEGAELREDGAVGVQGMLASTARLQHMQAALQTLKAQHQAYQDNAAVDAALARILAQLPAALHDIPHHPFENLPRHLHRRPVPVMLRKNLAVQDG